MKEKKTVYIVTGLPRSGTSMMMRMLLAGGLEVVSDNVRQADEDNPEGYFELESVKNVKEDTSWLADAGGKVVKMVSMLLYDLPLDYEYKVIFMRREMAEILASQKAMLARKGEKQKQSDGEMGKLYERHLKEILEWLARQTNISFVEIDYNQIMNDPLSEINKLNSFLGGLLSSDKMAEIVNTDLYRQRREEAAGEKEHKEGQDEDSSINEDEQSQIEAQLKSLGYM